MKKIISVCMSLALALGGLTLTNNLNNADAATKKATKSKVAVTLSKASISNKKIDQTGVACNNAFGPNEVVQSKSDLPTQFPCGKKAYTTIKVNVKSKTKISAVEATIERDGGQNPPIIVSLMQYKSIKFPNVITIASANEYANKIDYGLINSAFTSGTWIGLDQQLRGLEGTYHITKINVTNIHGVKQVISGKDLPGAFKSKKGAIKINGVPTTLTKTAGSTNVVPGSTYFATFHLANANTNEALSKKNVKYYVTYSLFNPSAKAPKYTQYNTVVSEGEYQRVFGSGDDDYENYDASKACKVTTTAVPSESNDAGATETYFYTNAKGTKAKKIDKTYVKAYEKTLCNKGGSYVYDKKTLGKSGYTFVKRYTSAPSNVVIKKATSVTKYKKGYKILKKKTDSNGDVKITVDLPKKNITDVTIHVFYAGTKNKFSGAENSSNGYATAPGSVSASVAVSGALNVSKTPKHAKGSIYNTCQESGSPAPKQWSDSCFEYASHTSQALNQYNFLDGQAATVTYTLKKTEDGKALYNAAVKANKKKGIKAVKASGVSVFFDLTYSKCAYGVETYVVDDAGYKNTTPEKRCVRKTIYETTDEYASFDYDKYPQGYYSSYYVYQTVNTEDTSYQKFVKKVYYKDPYASVTKRISGKTNSKGKVTLKIARPADISPLSSGLVIQPISSLGFKSGEWTVENQSENAKTILNFTTMTKAEYTEETSSNNQATCYSSGFDNGTPCSYQNNPNIMFPVTDSYYYDN